MDEATKEEMKRQAKVAVLGRIKDAAEKNRRDSIQRRALEMLEPAANLQQAVDDDPNGVQRIDNIEVPDGEGNEFIRAVEPPTAQQLIESMKGRVAANMVKSKLGAQDAMKYFVENRVEIEAKREDRVAREFEAMKMASGTLVDKMIFDRVANAAVKATELIGRSVRVRIIKDKLEIVEDNDYQIINENANMKIVACPPHFRAIHTGGGHDGNRVRGYQVRTLAMPWVVFGHVWYDTSNHRRERDRNNGRRRDRINYSNHIFVGFANELPTMENNVRIYAPPLPHVGPDGTICTGAVEHDNKRLTGSLTDDQGRNVLVVEDYISAFWNNAFVYETHRGYGWNTWEKWTQEEILQRDWSKTSNGTRGLRLRSWPEGIKAYRDYFDEPIARR